MSEIRANTISDAAGTGPVTLTKQSAAKAFVNVNMSSGTPTAGDSFNVSSLTDIGVGRVQPNLTSAMSSAAYVLTINTNHFSGSATTFAVGDEAGYAKTTTNYTAATNNTTAAVDAAIVDSAVLGDLA